MDKNYWLGRWQRKETRWHQSEVEPLLIQFFPVNQSKRVFVPLCGKSLDLIWLASQGQEVIGIELSEIACEAFFSENKISFKKTLQNEFTIYQSNNITLLNGDFFKLTPALLGPIDTVYDRAALIALPPTLRSEYTAHMTTLIQTCAKNSKLEMLQVALERIPQDEKGPPFSISSREITEYYQQNFKIELLHREKVDMGPDEKGISEESLYRLILR